MPGRDDREDDDPGEVAPGEVESMGSTRRETRRAIAISTVALAAVVGASILLIVGNVTR